MGFKVAASRLIRNSKMLVKGMVLDPVKLSQHPQATMSQLSRLLRKYPKLQLNIINNIKTRALTATIADPSKKAAPSVDISAKVDVSAKTAPKGEEKKEKKDKVYPLTLVDLRDMSSDLIARCARDAHDAVTQTPLNSDHVDDVVVWKRTMHAIVLYGMHRKGKTEELKIMDKGLEQYHEQFTAYWRAQEKIYTGCFNSNFAAVLVRLAQFKLVNLASRYVKDQAYLPCDTAEVVSRAIHSADQQIKM